MPVYAAYNGKKELDAKSFNAGVAAVAARSDVVLLSECEKKYQVDGTQALSAKGHTIFWPQTVAGRPVVHPANNEPIIWRPALFDVLAGSKRSVLGLKGEGGRWPHRYVNSLILIEKATGHRVGVLSVHTPAKAYTHPDKDERDHRREKWDELYAKLLAETKRLAQLCDYVVGGADLNCPHELDPSGIRMVYAGATFEGKPYDALWTAGPATVSGIHKLKTRSDHQAVIATITSPTTPEEPVATSQNGYAANTAAKLKTWTIPGTTRKVRLEAGSPGALLVNLAAWFDKNVEDIEAGVLDDWGYAERPIRGSTTTLSNHASGTALDLNATRHVLTKRDTFTNAQEKKIRDRLKVYDGAIRWGGDYKNRADEMHFEIIADRKTCDRIWAELNKPAATPPAKPPAPKPPAPKPAPAKVDRLDRAGDELRTGLEHVAAGNRNLALVDYTGIPADDAARIHEISGLLLQLQAELQHRIGQLPRNDKEARA